MVYLSIEKRARICALFDEGFPFRYIADKENVSQSTVIRTKQHKDKTGNNKNKPKSECPWLLTGRYKWKVLRLITTGECSNAVAIQKKLKIEEQIEVSECTVKRTLHKNGISVRVKCKKLYIQ